MKKFVLYTLGGTVVFITGAATGTVIAGAVLLPFLDHDKVAEKLIYKFEKAVFGETTASKRKTRSNVIHIPPAKDQAN